MKKVFSLLAAALLFTLSVNAQIKISGKIVDNKLGTLPGATIHLLGTDIVTISDQDGQFQIVYPDKQQLKLEIRFLGFDKKVIILDGQNDVVLNVQLEPSRMVSEMVVVKGIRANIKDPIVYQQVSREELNESNMTQDIPYLIRMTPSLVTTSDAGSGIGYTGLRIRGTDPSRINVTINGIPYNDSESHDVYWVNIPDFVSSVDNIQIQRGIGSSTNGAAAFGANVSIQTKTLNPKPYATWNTSAGSFNTFKNTLSVGTGLLNNKFTVDFRASDLTSDGYIDRAFAKMRSYYVSAGWFTDKSILKFTAFQGKELTYQAWGGVPAELIATNRTYNPYTYENEVDDYQQTHFQLHWTYELNPNLNFNMALHYTKGAGYYEQFKDGEDFEDYLLDAVYTENDTILSTDLVRRKWLDNDFYGAIYNLNYTNDNFLLQLGGGLNQYDGDHFGRIIWAQYASNSTPDKNYYFSNGLKTDANSFAKLNYSVFSNLNLFADIQYRFIDYKIKGLDDDQRDLTQEHNYNFFNPKAGLVYSPGNNHRLYASFALGHREPKRSNFTDAKPGQEIRPESMTDVEAGYSLNADRFNAGFNLYWMNYKDQLVLSGEINDVGSAIMVNVPLSYRAGIELQSDIRFTDQLLWKMNATFSRNKIQNFTEFVDDWDTWGQREINLGESDLAFSPNIIFGSRFQWKLMEVLSISWDTKYVGSQFIDNSSDQEKSLDAYFLNDLIISYTPKIKGIMDLRVFAQVNNLLNHEYESNAWVYSYYYEGQRNHMLGYYPQAGRNFMLGLQIGF